MFGELIILLNRNLKNGVHLLDLLKSVCVLLA